MARRLYALTALVLVAALMPLPAVKAALVPTASAAPGCAATANPAAAASELLGAGTSVTRLDDVAGRESALVSVSNVVVGGARHRLVRVGDGWCDALAGFNAAPRLGVVETATAFASLAAARYFDGVTVRNVRVVTPGVVSLETHARTNGVVADWQVVVDDTGVRTAKWEATGFAVAPFEFEVHGPTALPGASMEYRRAGDGLLAAAQDPFTAAIATTAAATTAGVAPAAPPVATSVVETSDGNRIVVSRGQAPYAYSSAARTGVNAVDINEIVARTTRTNYEDFLSWGMSGMWGRAPGQVFIDGGLAAYCMACVLPQRLLFNVSISSLVGEYLALAGYTYPDFEDMIALVMGHEIFHNFQVASGSLDFGSAYIEGTARLSETLHDYSAVSNQPNSLTYGRGWDGCNGYIEDMGESFSRRWYESCFMWMSFYVDHGLGALVELTKLDGADLDIEDAVAQVTGVPFETTMAKVATRALTGDGMQWGPAMGDGPALDWSLYVDKWDPAALAPLDEGLGAGAIAGGRVTATTPVSLSATGPAAFSVVRRGANGVSTTSVANATEIAGPAPGEDVWLTVAGGADYSSVRVAMDGSVVTPGVPKWSEQRFNEYEDALLPTDSASATATGTLEARDFAVAAAVYAATPASFAYEPYASASTYFRSVVPVQPGVYAFTVDVALDSSTLSGSTGLLRSSASNGVSVSAWCTRTYCDDYDSWYSYSDYQRSATNPIVLHGSVAVDEAQSLEFRLSLGSYASSPYGDATASMQGRVTELKLTRIS